MLLPLNSGRGASILQERERKGQASKIKPTTKSASQATLDVTHHSLPTGWYLAIIAKALFLAIKYIMTYNNLLMKIESCHMSYSITAFNHKNKNSTSEKVPICLRLWTTIILHLETKGFILATMVTDSNSWLKKRRKLHWETWQAN